MIRKKISIFIIFTIIILSISSVSVLAINTYYQRFELSNSKSINSGEPYEGYVLFSPEFSTNTFLIDINGDIVHSWDSNYMQGLPVYLLENGDLIRGCSKINNPRFVAGGFTGRVEKYDWNGNLLWEYDYSTNQYCLHHDIEVLPNGNILMIAWEYKTAAEAVAVGRNPNNIQGGQLWPDKIIEVEPTGSSNGDIVWEWHVWDHLIQDYDPTKDNYGVIADHPELIDINSGGRQTDFNHINSVDYNEELDQILLSSHNQNEIWIIDHGTTTEEAAGHTGGIYGKGGDLIYRWGNPQVYDAGGTADQQLFSQHDTQWIKDGYPGEGNILIFNNGQGRSNGKYTSVDEIIPPISEDGNYVIEPGESFDPDNPIWSYTADNPSDFFADKISGAERLPNGNTLICDGPSGYFFEVTVDKKIIWEYVNTYPLIGKNSVFKIHKYGIDYPGLSYLFQKPDKPSTPNGSTEGTVGLEYTYTSSTSDPDNDQLYYWFDWGDESNSGWLGPYNSGEEISTIHIWNTRGNYEIQVKAKDIHGLESEWSDTLVISMSKIKSIGNFNSWILRLVLRFPILYFLI